MREMGDWDTQIMAVSHQFHGNGLRLKLRLFVHVGSEPGGFRLWQRDEAVPVAIQQFNGCEEDALILAAEPEGAFLMQSEAVRRRDVPATLFVFRHGIGVGGRKSAFRPPRNQWPRTALPGFVALGLAHHANMKGDGHLIASPWTDWAMC